jgi:hypothetical protein
MIIQADDSAIVEMFEQQLISVLVALYFVLSMDLYPLMWHLDGRYLPSKVLFENKESQTKGGTTVLQNHAHPSQ